MKNESLDKQNSAQTESVLRPCLDCLEEDAPVSSSSTVCYDKVIGGKQLIFNCKHHSNSRSSKKCSKCRRFNIKSCANFVEDQSLYNHGFQDFAVSDSFYDFTPPESLPFNFTLSKQCTESFKLHRRTRSTNYYGDSILQYATGFGQRKLIVSPSVKWSYDSIEIDEKVSNFSKGSVVIHLADIHSKGKGLTNVTRSPSSIRHIESAKVREGYLGKHRSSSKMSDLTFISSSSLKSTCSYQSELSEYDIVSKGLLKCAWKNGLPYFDFSLGEGHGEVFVANPLKVEFFDHKALDYLYVFYSRTNIKKGGCLDYTYHVIGKMKVSSSLSLSSNKSKIVETEFVLFDVSKDKKDVFSSSSISHRSNGLPEKMLDVFRKNGHNSQNSVRYAGVKGPHGNEFSQHGKMDPTAFFMNNFMASLELSAIIVRDYQCCNQMEKAFGGWGLKFLSTHDDASNYQSHDLYNCSIPGRAEDDHRRSIDVLIPADSHGVPLARARRPSSLIERWRTGGRCDCGGWDIGCPLTVLHDQPSCATTSPVDYPQENLKSVNLFAEGAKAGDPAALRLMELNEDLFALSFQSKLSALQAFSIGVATIHSRAPSLKPHL